MDEGIWGLREFVQEHYTEERLDIAIKIDINRDCRQRPNSLNAIAPILGHVISIYSQAYKHICACRAMLSHSLYSSSFSDLLAISIGFPVLGSFLC